MSECTCNHGAYKHGENGCFAKVSGPSSDDYYCDCSWVPVSVQKSIIDMNRVRSLLTKACKKHPRYEAKRRPRSACEGCWRLWIAIYPDGEPIDLSEIMKPASAQARLSSPTPKRRGSSARR